MLRNRCGLHQECTDTCVRNQMVPTRSQIEPEEAAQHARIDVAEMLEGVLGCKWTVRLLCTIAQASARPSELLRAHPGLSAKVMNERLRKLLRYAIIRREVFGDKPPVEVVYSLAPFGERFTRLLTEIERLQDELSLNRPRPSHSVCVDGEDSSESGVHDEG